MTAALAEDPTIPHGTPTGYARGCRTKACPAEVSCARVQRLCVSDYTFNKMYKAGMEPKLILAEIEEVNALARTTAPPPKPKPVYRAPKPRKPRLAPVVPPGAVMARKDDIQRMCEEGASDEAIAKALGFSRAGVQRVRVEMGLETGSTRFANTLGNTLQWYGEVVKSLNAQQVNDAEIARSLGAPKLAIRRLRLHFDLPMIGHNGNTIERFAHGTPSAYERGCRCLQCQKLPEANRPNGSDSNTEQKD